MKDQYTGFSWDSICGEVAVRSGEKKPSQWLPNIYQGILHMQYRIQLHFRVSVIQYLLPKGSRSEFSLGRARQIVQDAQKQPRQHIIKARQWKPHWIHQPSVLITSTKLLNRPKLLFIRFGYESRILPDFHSSNECRPPTMDSKDCKRSKSYPEETSAAPIP